MVKSKEYISLEEAAKISGYAPDYVGQLVREGKISGKRVYCNVAWVVHEPALLAYVEGGRRKGGEKKTLGGGWEERARKVRMSMMSDAKMSKLLRGGLYAVTGISVLFALLMMYVLSLTIDHKLEGRFQEKPAQKKTRAIILEGVEL